MKLNETNQFIKDNFQNIIDGKFDDKFSKEQLSMMLEMSFLYNHIHFGIDEIIFKYSGVELRISNIHEMIHSQISEEEILYMIRKENSFKSSYTSFLRDNKIKNILN